MAVIVDKVERVKQLKREGRHEEALAILLDWVQSMEGSPDGVAPWPYEHLAIIYRKLKRHDEEQDILERFAREAHGLGATPPKLLARAIIYLTNPALGV